MKYRHWLTLGCATLMWVGCGSDDNGGDSPADAGTPKNTCSAELTYEKVGKPFAQSYCVSCHSSKVKGAARMTAPSDVNLDTEADMFMHGTHVAEYVEEKLMPPPATSSLPKPTAQERTSFLAWTACSGVAKSHTAPK